MALGDMLVPTIVRLTAATVLFILPQLNSALSVRTMPSTDAASVASEQLALLADAADQSGGAPDEESAATAAVYTFATGYADSFANASLLGEATLASGQKQLHDLTEKQYHLIRSTKKLLWVLGSYHKTGTELAMRFIGKIAQKGMTRNNEQRLKGKDMIFSEEKPMGNFYFNPEAPIVQALPHYRFVHFIRDPVELVLSAYRYHVQGTEPWLHVPVLELRRTDKSSIKTMFNNFKELSDYVPHPQKDQALRHFRKAVKEGRSLYQYYRHAPEKEAIFIELFRSWREIQLIMSNYIATRQDPYTVQVRMESVQKDFHSSMKCLVQFLHGSASTMPSVHEAMTRLEELDVSKHPEHTKAVHVTTGKYDNSKLLKLLETVKPLMEARGVLQLPAVSEC